MSSMRCFRIPIFAPFRWFHTVAEANDHQRHGEVLQCNWGPRPYSAHNQEEVHAPNAHRADKKNFAAVATDMDDIRDHVATKDDLANLKAS